MISSIRTMWLSILVSMCVVVTARAAGGDEYLPPNKGYNYEPPAIPFPPNNNPIKQPTPPPYRPPQRPSPPPQRPTYIPPSPQPHEHQDDHHEHHEDHHHHEPGMPFDFSYAVSEDDNNFSHNAISDGDVTRGEYRVALPDGRTQIVKYTADWKNGFNADVSYEGEARYPDAPVGGYGRGPASGPSGYGRGPASGPSGGGQQYSEGGGYQY